MRVAKERPPVERIVRPFQDFAHKQSSGGILLIAATAVALVWANSPWGDSYAALWHTKLTMGIGDLSLSKDLAHWINDGLMAVFFLVVGLEIKREVLVGELSSVRNAALPIVAALGGAVVPALIYLAINAGTEGAVGWDGAARSSWRLLPAVLALRPLLGPLRKGYDVLFLGWFGPVGAAALYYAAFSPRETGIEEVWVVGSLIICASVMVHGVTATPLTKLYGRSIRDQ